MSGKTKQAHRTKNNVRPSSSGRSAELLSSTVSPALVTVGPGNLLPAVFPSLAGHINQPVSNEFLVCFKKFHKKDPITKLKALNELNELVAKSEQDEVVNALGNWVHYYPALTVDTDRKVREATQTCHGAIVRKCGRRVAPHLKRMLPAWLMAQHDEYAPVQRAAQASLQETFPNEKLAEAIKFCKVEICNLYMDNLKGNAEYMLSGKKLEDPEEHAAVLCRVACSTLRALRLLLAALPPAQDAWLWDALLPLLCARAYWQLAQHTDHHVRAAFYSVCGGVLQRFAARLPSELATRAARTLLARSEPPPAARVRWRTLLCALLHVPDFLDLVDHNLLEKRLFEVFENVAWGEAGPLREALPALLPLLPGRMQAAPFYDRLFTTLLDGLRQTSLAKDEAEREAWSGIIAGALRYVSTAHRDDAAAVALVGRTHRAWLRAPPAAHTAHAAAHMAALLDYWARAAADAGHPAFDALVQEFWANVREVAADDGTETALLQLLVGLRRALAAPPPSPPEPPADPVRERCLRDLSGAADEVLTHVLHVAHARRTVSSILPAAMPALVEFNSLELFAGLARKFGAESALQFYENAVRTWLADDDQRCEAIVEFVFLMMQHLGEKEQDAILDSFETLSPSVVEWCVSRVVGAAGGAAAGARWLGGAAGGRALLALLPRRPDLLLAALARSQHDGSISESTVQRIVSACCELLSEVVEGSAGEGEGEAGGERVRLAARVGRALAAGGGPLLRALFRVTLHVPRDSGLLEETAWSEALEAWRDGCRHLPPPLHQRFVTDALRDIQRHLFRDAENLDIGRIDHAVSLCPHLEGSAAHELTAHVRQVVGAMRGEGEQVPLEVFALQADVIFGDLSCSLEDCAWLTEARGRPQLSVAALVSRATRMLFRAGYLQTLFYNTRDDLARDKYFVDQLCELLYDYGVMHVLDDHYAFWKHYDIIRATKERLEEVVSKAVEVLPSDTREAVEGVLRARALSQGYYWAHAAHHYERLMPRSDVTTVTVRPSEAGEESERTDSIQSHTDTPCACHRLRGTPREAFAPLLPPDLAPAAPPAAPRADLASRCERAAAYRDFLSDMMTRSGLFHVAQMKGLEAKRQKRVAKAKFEEQQDLLLCDFEVTGKGEMYARWEEGASALASGTVNEDALTAAELVMVRSFYCAVGERAPVDALVADVGAERGRANLDAVINGYYRDNDTMLFERSLSGASWAQLCGTAATLDLLCAAIPARGWEASALHWDFTNIALCSALASLALSTDLYTEDPFTLAVLARPALELYARARQFVAGVRRECTRRQPSAHVAALPREWADIFAPDATANIYRLICHVLDKSSRTICASQAAVLRVLTRAARRLEASVVSSGAGVVERAARAAARALAAPAHHGYKYLAYYTLRSLAPALIAADEARAAAAAARPADDEDEDGDGDEGGGQGEGLSLALYDTHLRQLQELVDAALSDYTVCSAVCETAPHSDSRALVLGHLLLAAALHRHCLRATGDMLHRYHNYYNSHGYVEGVLCAALRVLPAEAARVMAAPGAPARALLPWFIRPQDLDLQDECTSVTVSRLACGAVTLALEWAGGAARGWWAVLGARAGAGLARLVAAYVAPPLVHRQLAEVLAKRHELKDQAKITVSASEWSVSCELQEGEGEGGALCVQLSAAHPLRAPRVHSAPPAPNAHLFAVYLGYRNGSVMEALRMWVSAACAGEGGAGGGGGGAPCYVCYCRAHPLDGCEPAVHCRQCRNCFHSRCLRRWFKTSNRSNCPVCRTNF